MSERTNAAATARIPISAPFFGIRLPKKTIRKNAASGNDGISQLYLITGSSPSPGRAEVGHAPSRRHSLRLLAALSEGETTVAPGPPAGRLPPLLELRSRRLRSQLRSGHGAPRAPGTGLGRYHLRRLISSTFTVSRLR